mgnify:FL=1
MLPTYRNEKFTLTAIKAQKVLAQYGTHLTLKDVEIMLELLRRLCKLSVSETFRDVYASKNQVPREGEV